MSVTKWSKNVKYTKSSLHEIQFQLVFVIKFVFKSFPSYDGLMESENVKYKSVSFQTITTECSHKIKDYTFNFHDKI